MASVRVSLCMIVCDEAKMIDACLASARDLVSEMIVVDTGSQDDTAARARRAGAKVVEVAWQNDFSHARNVSLSHATGDWVLVLDADERLAPADFPRLRRLLARASCDCGMLRLHDAVSLRSTEADVLSGKERIGDPQRVPRLFRRQPGMQYVGVVHEDLSPWFVRHGARLAPVDLDIVHYGATRELYDGRAKFERNVRLLTDLARQSPSDPVPLGYLAWQHLEHGDLADAQRAAEEGWRRLTLVDDTSPDARPSVLRLVDARALIQLRLGDFRGVLDTVQRARRFEDGHSDLDYLAGYALERAAVVSKDVRARDLWLATARACFEACLAAASRLQWHAYVVGGTGWGALTRLGSIALLRGDPAGARQSFEAALRLNPKGMEARLGLLEAALHEAGGGAALETVGELMRDEEVRATPDLWVLAAAACEQVGAIDDMAKFVAQARGRKAEYVAPHRRTLYGECLTALALYTGKPCAGPGLLGAIGALAARQPVPPGEVGAYPSMLGSVRTLVKNLSRLGRVELLEPLFEPRADVVAPGLTEHVRQAAAELGIALVYEPPPAAIAVRGAEAAHVAALLASHPRLSGRVRVAHSDEAATDARCVVTGDLEGEVPSGGAHVTWQALLDDPVRQTDALLAALGEGDCEPLVRHLVEVYCDPPRAAEVAPG